MEEWKDIKGYEGLYQVSSEGRIKSLERKVKHCDHLITIKEKMLKSHMNSDGYPMASLCKNGITESVYMHRILAEAFIENPDNKPEVDHIIPVSEGGTNELSNLRWVTHKENLNNIISVKKNSVTHKGRKSWMKDKHHTEESKIKMSENKKGKPLIKLRKQVYQYTLDGELVKIWDSVNECGRNGYSQGCISQCCNGIKKQYKGYIWSYEKL